MMNLSILLATASKSNWLSSEKKTEFRLNEFHILQSAYHESLVTYLFGQ